jgi:hypothetical protein
MDSNPASQEPPAGLPSDLTDDLDSLDRVELRAVRDYVEGRVADIRPSIADQIEPLPGEKSIEIIEEGPYTLVVKRQPCEEGCERCPHGPYLYRVRREVDSSFDPEFHWSYLGIVIDEEGD